VHVRYLWEVVGGERTHQPRTIEIPLRLDASAPSTATPSPVRYASTSFGSTPPRAASERQRAAIAYGLSDRSASACPAGREKRRPPPASRRRPPPRSRWRPAARATPARSGHTCRRVRRARRP
jgi:hypothetical protein